MPRTLREASRRIRCCSARRCQPAQQASRSCCRGFSRPCTWGDRDNPLSRRFHRRNPRMATLTWHGHSCFTLETDEKQRIIIDPWIDENPMADIKTSDIEALDYILVSHGHSDHFADVVKLAKKTGATVVSTFELVAFCQSQGVKKGHGMNIGGAYVFDFGRVKLTPALHTGSISGDETGAHTTDPAGFLISLNGGQRLYHAG